MADKTEFTSEMNRAELASYLHEIAEQFESEEEGPVTVTLGNKRVTLRPSDSLNCDVAVTERSSLLRKNRQELSINVQWKDTGGD